MYQYNGGKGQSRCRRRAAARQALLLSALASVGSGLSSCAQRGSPVGSAGADLPLVVVENHTGQRLVVYLAKAAPGADGVHGNLLGRVGAVETRTFHVQWDRTSGAEFMIFAVAAPGPAESASVCQRNCPLPASGVAPFETAPFAVTGVRRVRWNILEGRRLTAVMLH